MIVSRPTPRSAWSEHRVIGLGDAVDDARVLDAPLASIRTRQSEPTDEVTGPALILGADTYASPALATSLSTAANGAPFVRLGRGETTAARFADPLSRLPRADGRILFDAWFLADGQTIRLDDEEKFESAPVVEDEVREKVFEYEADPEVVEGGLIRLGFTSSTCAPVGHWVELIRTNLLAHAARGLEASPGKKLAKLLSAPYRAKSFDPDRMLAAMTTTGDNCAIHPTAWVEASVLGNDVEVGPGAIVRHCFVADGARIDAQTIAEMSVIGAGARLQRRSMVNLSVVYPRARIGGVLQLGLAGTAAALKMFGVGTDMRLDGPVRVASPDGYLPVDISYQGVCLGHGAFVGSGVWIAPGRVIEGGRRVGRDRSLFVL